jgi:Xaa-Pro aminopeptidase
MDHPARRSRLAARLSELDVEAMLVTHTPNVRFLTGFTGSNGQAVLTEDGGAFVTDGRYEEQSAREVPDLRRVVSTEAFPALAAKVCADLGVQRVAFEAERMTFAWHATLAEAGLGLVPISGVVEGLRWAKEPEELRRLEAAQGIADRTFERVLATLRAGVTEREVAVRIDLTMRELGADAVSFDSIVAFGPGAAEPHHHPTDRPLERGQVVKMDFGALVDGYHSDMTRTVAFGDPGPRLREVYEVVRRAQRAGVDAVRPGVTGHEVDGLVRGILIEAGLEDGIQHSLGHGVGLEIHEAPWLRPGWTERLPRGAVVTVEPGIYLPGEGGVRIEDMVEVTVDGPRVIPTTTKDLLVL